MIFINDSQDLIAICLQIGQSPSAMVGLDTEFIRHKTYYPILCLIQGIFVRTDGAEETFLIDPLIKDIDMKPFIDILKNQNIKKIIHSSGQDLDALQFFLNLDRINGLEDTQIMAGFCDYDCSMGYLSTVNRVLNVNLTKNKNLQTSNWFRRPLQKRQLKYACEDVKYLLELYNNLLARTIGYGNYEFYRSDMEYLQKHRERDFIIANSWERLKFRIHKKTMGCVMLMKDLASWREARAMENNKIRSLIFKDNTLQILARVRPGNKSDFRRLYSTNREILNIDKVYKKDIMELINRPRIDSKYDHELYYTGEIGFAYTKELGLLYSKIVGAARSRHICMERVINKMDLIALMMGYKNKENVLYGWKSELLGEICGALPQRHFVSRT